MAQSYLRDAERKRAEETKARSAAADFSTKVATAQVAVHKAEQKLAKAHDDERKKRETEERRQRERTERAAKDAERARLAADAARDARLANVGTVVSTLGADVASTRALIASEPWRNVPEKISVLFLTGEPDGTEPLQLSHEIREIQDQVRKSQHRDAIEFHYRPAARVTEMIQHLNEVEPDVIHFSGHGAETGIALHGTDDGIRLMTNDEIDRLLAVAPKPLKLVVLNSCNSAEQARVASKHAAAAIGMQQSIEDDVARVFAGQLYNGLGFGRSLGLAMKQAELYVELQLNRTSGDPTLELHDGVDADELVIVAPPVQG